MRIDPNRQLAARRATKQVLDKFFISRKTYARGKVSFRILVDGELYDVSPPQLAALREGIAPAELELEPVRED
jgi:hypothetical protein